MMEESLLLLTDGLIVRLADLAYALYPDGHSCVSRESVSHLLHLFIELMTLEVAVLDLHRCLPHHDFQLLMREVLD